MMNTFAVENIANSALKTINRARTSQVVSAHIAVKSATALVAIETI